MIKIIAAKTAGFCEGVQQAIHHAEKAAESGEGKIYTLGPLVHNPQVIQMLKEKGVCPVDRTEQIESGTVVIRSHGIPPDLRKKFRAQGLKISAARCLKNLRIPGAAGA